MKALEIKLPDEIFSVLSTITEQKEKFVVEAIKEKIEREKKYSLLVEGYQATSEEDLVLTKEFELIDLKLIRPFSLSEGDFIVPDDFDAPLPKEIEDLFH